MALQKIKKMYKYVVHNIGTFFKMKKSVLPFQTRKKNFQSSHRSPFEHAKFRKKNQCYQFTISDHNFSSILTH